MILDWYVYQDFFIEIYEWLISVIVLDDETSISFLNLEKSDIQIIKKWLIRFFKSSSIMSESELKVFLSLENIFKKLSSFLNKEFSDDLLTELSYLFYSAEENIDLK